MVVLVGGEFDLATVDQFDQAVAPYRTQFDLIVDLASTTLLDSTALGALLRLRRDSASTDNSLIVLAPRSYQRRLFEVTGLEFLLAVDDENSGNN